VLYNRDRRFAHRLMAFLNAEKEFTIGDNAPYTVSDASDYTVPVHAERRGLHHVLIEIRQDLLADEDGQRDWALRLRAYCRSPYRELWSTGGETEPSRSARIFIAIPRWPQNG